ncbi:MAG: hypothetical protein LBG59_06955 [Candidatus Peribacteria bacterium]|jgi:thymidylate kinase|nr:hypothetical protein [Candidatus Peribacteria bacterium]
MTTQGKLIVLYGINRLGKTTQAKKLVQWLQNQKISAEYLKYPVYDLSPWGPECLAYLKQGNPKHLTPEQFQMRAAFNRAGHQEYLENLLARGIWVVAEDYSGTGIAWGTAHGVDSAFLAAINEPLLKEDIAFFFDGDPFREATEPSHLHEQNDVLTAKARKIHQNLAQKYGWIPINANASIEEIHQGIKQTIQQHVRNE